MSDTYLTKINKLGNEGLTSRDLKHINGDFNRTDLQYIKEINKSQYGFYSHY